jgi:cytochrome c peroxidase
MRCNKLKRRTGIISAIFVCLTAAGFRVNYTDEPYKVSVPAYFPEMPTSGSNHLTRKGVSLGRFLFYDPILSKDSNLSCASCHKQAAAFSDAPNAFSTGSAGALQKRNTPAIFNLAWYPALFWDGRAGSIELQVFQPVRHHDEMNLEWTLAAQRIKRSKFYLDRFFEAFGERQIDSSLIANAIAQFERTIISCSSKYDRVLQRKAVFTKEEADGFVLVNDMVKAGCLHCHTTDADPLGTTSEFSNNGLDPVLDPAKYKDIGRGGVTSNVGDNGKFRIPSLRNIALTPPYMHDGRFKTLDEVIDFYSERVNPCVNIDSKMEFARRGGAHLTADQKRQIIAFLHTLTDSALITDKKYSNPFVEARAKK